VTDELDLQSRREFRHQGLFIEPVGVHVVAELLQVCRYSKGFVVESSEISHTLGWWSNRDEVLHEQVANHVRIAVTFFEEVDYRVVVGIRDLEVVGQTVWLSA